MGQSIFHKTIDSDGHEKVSVHTHLLLGEVMFSEESATGDRIPEAQFVISPKQFGGLLGVFSEQYEAYNIETIDIEYRTSSPTTTEGALALYYFGDPSTPAISTGETAKLHASTADEFVQIPIWDNGMLRVKPLRLTEKSLTEDDKVSPPAASQGIISAMVAAPTNFAAGTGYKSVGSLYAKITAHFYEAKLNLEMVTSKVSDDEFICNTYAAVVDQPLLAGATAGVGTFQYNFGILPTSSSIRYGVITELTGDFLSGISVATPTVDFKVSLGQLIFMRFWDFYSTSHKLVSFHMTYADATTARIDAYDDAGTLKYDPDVANGTILWYTTATLDGTFRIRSRILELIDQ
jgi:hypothetical protein